MFVGWESDLFSTSPVTREEKIQMLTSSMRWKKRKKWLSASVAMVALVATVFLWWNNARPDYIVYSCIIGLVLTYFTIELEIGETDLAIKIYHLQHDHEGVLDVT